MKALLLIAHGSRKPTANDEVMALGRLLRERAGDYDLVETAFLEIAEPSIPAGIERCVEQGADRILALPYFLSAGNHVISDIPGEIDCARQRFPGVRIEQADYLGKSPEVAGILLGLANAVQLD